MSLLAWAIDKPVSLDERAMDLRRLIARWPDDRAKQDKLEHQAAAWDSAAHIVRHTKLTRLGQ